MPFHGRPREIQERPALARAKLWISLHISQLSAGEIAPRGPHRPSEIACSGETVVFNELLVSQFSRCPIARRSTFLRSKDKRREMLESHLRSRRLFPPRRWHQSKARTKPLHWSKSRNLRPDGICGCLRPGSLSSFPLFRPSVG
jgi:hypothetical protein